LSYRNGRKCSGDAHDTKRLIDISSNDIHQEQFTNIFSISC
jgi:hypothetical protein